LFRSQYLTHNVHHRAETNIVNVVVSDAYNRRKELIFWNAITNSTLRTEYSFDVRIHTSVSKLTEWTNLQR